MSILKKFFFNEKVKMLKEKLDFTKVPKHVAVIMDGNGRWAKKRGLPRNAGHKVGADTLDKIVRDARDLGIQYFTVYAFSTENWVRPKEEVDALMNMFSKYLSRYINEYKPEDKIILRLIGNTSVFDEGFKNKIQKIEELTSGQDGMIFNVAINYGGRDEIVTAVKKIIDSGIDSKDISIQTVTDNLYTNNIPDPDLVIRTSGEQRLSNFLIWQSAYSEFYTTSTLWPDFDKEELMEAIYNYQNRKRRFGGI